ncbi:MAG TPA: hypothetical protein VLA72_12650 [Anaerolineales bacterium]|nr:hypothetical protein [Anaerolineales bacterium]
MAFDQFPDPDRPITDKDPFFIQISLSLAGSRPKQIVELVAGLEVAVIADVLRLQVVLFTHPAPMPPSFLVRTHFFHSIPGDILQFPPFALERRHDPIQ